MTISPTPPIASDTPTSWRALVYLALAVTFAAVVLLTMVWPNNNTTAAQACAAGTVISQAAVATDASGANHLFAVVRPAAAPNIALGNEPGCEALYIGDAAGLSWTVSFSATAEAPLSIVPAGASTLYLLTQRVQFSLYLAGNLYRSDNLGSVNSWLRVSPQDRHAVPSVSVTDQFLDASHALLLRVANGDGAALLRSTDQGAHWQPVVIPRLLSTSSVAVQRSAIAVAPSQYVPGQSPGAVSTDGGVSWAPLGPLPGAPARLGLRAVVSAGAAGALVLELVPVAALAGTPVIMRYASSDDGRTWRAVHCSDLPAPGCAPSARWASTNGARYVLYRRRLFKAASGRPWQPLPYALPVPSAAVLQLLAVTGKPVDTLYLVAATGIWRLQDGAWHDVATGLGLGGPAALEG